MKLSAVVLAVLLLGGDALATTWAPSEKTDPMTGEKVQGFFAQVKDVKYKDAEGKEQTGHPYFVELVKDRQKLMTERSSNKSDADDGN